MKRNTLEEYEYITEHIKWTLIALIFFVPMFLRCIPRCTYLQTWVVLGMILLGTVCIGVSITYKWGRNYINLAQHVICGYGIFVLIAYWEVFSDKMLRVLYVTMAFTGVGVFFLIIKRTRKRVQTSRLIKVRAYQCAACLRRNFSIAFVMIMVPIGVMKVYSGTLLSAEMSFSIPEYGEEHSMESNMDKLINLQEERFAELSVEEKLELCRLVCLSEAQYLGIKGEVNVCTADLDEGVRGYYDDGINRVCISVQHLNQGTSYEVVKTLLHEMNHMYMHQLVESYHEVSQETRNLLLYRQLAEVMEEMVHYEDGSRGDYDVYRSQKLEVLARVHSEERVVVYFAKIEEYINKN